jgi:hypothetical protein
MSNPIVSIGRDTVEASLFDTKGGVVTLYKSLTGADQSAIASKYEGKKGAANSFDQAIDTIVACFVKWNIGQDGQVLPCTPDVLKRFTQRDLLAMLQACTGALILDEQGNLLSKEDAQKKGLSA